MKKIVVLACAICLLFSCTAADKTPSSSAGVPVGTVNGEPFYQEDIDIYALELRAAVAADYGRRFNLFAVGAKFWDTEYGGSTPNETLTRLALNDLVRNMVLIQEARRRKIDAPASYRDLETERAAWNTPTTEIVYGPKELGPAEFNNYRISGITDELKTFLLKKELAPTMAQMKAAYDSLPDTLKIAPFRVTGVHSIPGLTKEDFELDSRYISKEDPYEQELAQALENAKPGDMVKGPQGRPDLYYVTSKEGGGIFTFEQAPGLGRNKWINDQFELFLDKKVQAAKIKIYK
jgi:hypothetical protein